MIASGIALIVAGCGDRASAPDKITLQRLTDDPGRDWDPRWSPDGTKILFASSRGNTGDHIYIVPAAGGAATQLVAINANGARWSPDGDSVAFLAYRSGHSQIWMTPSSGGVDPVLLTTDPLDKADFEWSRDGKKIVYVAGRDARTIWMTATSGGNPDQITFGGTESAPRWSPDGSRIAFVSGTAGNRDIWMVPVAGGNLARLTTAPANYGDLQWSADGSRLAFISDRKNFSERFGVRHIWTVFIIGAEVTQITSDPRWAEGAIDWSPDAASFVFTRLIEGGDLWDVPATAIPGEPVRLTYDNSRVDRPRWSPDGRRIAYESSRGGNPDIWILTIK